MGASGPTLNPNVNVNNDNNNNGNNAFRLRGNVLASSGADDNAETKSATVNSFDLSVVTNKPPMVHVPIMKSCGFVSVASLVVSDDCHTVSTVLDRTLPYRYPIVADRVPTKIDVGKMLVVSLRISFWFIPSLFDGAGDGGDCRHCGCDMREEDWS